MHKLWRYFKKVDKTWKGIWLFIFCGFISMDAFFPGFFGITMLKLMGIAFCLLYVIRKYPQDKLLIAAFSMTFIADIFLTFNNLSFFGVFIFILAQFMHFSRIRGIKLQKIIFGVIGISIYFVISSAAGPLALFLLGALYAFFLISNLCLSYSWYKKSPKSDAALCAISGFVLFATCDFFVANSFFSTIHILPHALKRLFDFLAWAFYYPSQILIASSSKTR